ncbi:MAG: transposase [Prevotella sp.]|nr:transposase [Prevotella sp.]
MKPSIFLNELIDLKHMETLEKMPFEAQHKIFKRLAEIADSKTLTKEEQEKYDNSMMVMWDNYAVYKHAEEKGIIKGEAKGRAEGRVEEKKEIALNLLAYNTPIDIIAKSTGLSIEEIKKLKS